MSKPGVTHETVRGIPSEVVLTKEDGLPRECAINLDHIQTVARGRLGALIATVSDDKIRAVRQALLFSLGFDRL